MADEEEAALELAARALARRDLSRQALDRRLRAAGVAAPARGLAVGRLAAAGLLDDARLACRRADTLASRGLGDAAIAARLEEEGIGPDERRAALAALEPEEERARRLAAAERTPARLAAVLARRGFGEDGIAAALASLDGCARPELG